MPKNCPIEFYSNCSNALILCNKCIAMRSSAKKLHYNPISIEGNLGKHPEEGKSKTKARKIQKRAVKTEQDLKNNIAEGTLKSGAVLGDGDLSLLNGDLKVEVKDRGNSASWNLTHKEYMKGKKQGIDAYAISAVGPDNTRRTIYMLEEGIFYNLLALLKQVKQLEGLECVVNTVSLDKVKVSKGEIKGNEWHYSKLVELHDSFTPTVFLEAQLKVREELKKQGWQLDEVWVASDSTGGTVKPLEYKVQVKENMPPNY